MSKDGNKGLDPKLFESGLFDDDEPDNAPEESGFEDESDTSSESPDGTPEDNELGDDEVIVSEGGADDQDAQDDDEDQDSGDEDQDDNGNYEEMEDADATSDDDADAEPPSSDDADSADEAIDLKQSTPKKRRGRPPKQRPAEDAADDLNNSYVVQRGFVADGGKTYHPNDVIPVKCKFCALWKREWFGKVRCYPGKVMMDGSTMSADRYSCETFFIPKELEAELQNFLNMPVHEVQLVRRMIPGLKRLFDAFKWFDSYVESNKIAGDIEEARKNARGFVMAFDSTEQIVYAEEFIRLYANTFAKRTREKRPPRVVYRGGDWVEWTDLKSKERFEGIILGRGKGKITIAGVKVQQGTRFTFDFKEWKRKTDPKITRQSADNSGE